MIASGSIGVEMNERYLEIMKGNYVEVAGYHKYRNTSLIILVLVAERSGTCPLTLER
jgi:hypothetical protein